MRWSAVVLAGCVGSGAKTFDSASYGSDTPTGDTLVYASLSSAVQLAVPTYGKPVCTP